MAAELARRVAVAQGDAGAADALIRDYLPFIRAEASKATGRIVTEQDDAYSIAMIGFHEAIVSYRALRGAFLPYASVVIRRRLIDFYRKEKRHQGQLSLDQPDGGEDAPPLADRLETPDDPYTQSQLREATRQEIAELSRQLAGFGLSLGDIADNCPRQARTLTACQRALRYAKEDPAIIPELLRTHRLPMAKLAAGSGVERKTLERHRRYLMALLLIYSNGYEIIRGHLAQLLTPSKGGGPA